MSKVKLDPVCPSCGLTSGVQRLTADLNYPTYKCGPCGTEFQPAGAPRPTKKVNVAVPRALPNFADRTPAYVNFDEKRYGGDSVLFLPSWDDPNLNAVCSRSTKNPNTHLVSLDFDYECWLEEAGSFDQQLVVLNMKDPPNFQWGDWEFLREVLQKTGFASNIYVDTEQRIVRIWLLKGALPELIPSRSSGHFHLYMNLRYEWSEYEYLLGVMGECWMLEPNYVEASFRDIGTYLRYPRWLLPPEEDFIAKAGVQRPNRHTEGPNPHPNPVEGDTWINAEGKKYTWDTTTWGRGIWVTKKESSPT